MREKQQGNCNNYLRALFFFILLSTITQELRMLTTAPTIIHQYKEIAIKYNPHVDVLYNNLLPEERVFIYYLFRASLPGNHIAIDQLHRHGREIVSIFERLAAGDDILINENKNSDEDIDWKAFAEEVRIFLVYLWANHGQYFQVEHAHEKRTPQRLGLTMITPNNLVIALTKLGETNAAAQISMIEQVLFDDCYEMTGTVPNNIEKSAVNFYHPAMTEQDFASLLADQRTKINAYFWVTQEDGKRVTKMQPYSMQGKYAEELATSVFWLRKAHEHAIRHPETFDNHLITSLNYLITFLETGDEKWFKEHSIAWLKSSSRVDYNFGFVETYHDPKSYRGLFQAEATIKSVDIHKLNALLPFIEAQLPFPQEFKRQGLAYGSCPMPNASINQKVFGTGALGPLSLTAAYCLPNYEEIRATYGSKQIIYPADKGIAALLHPEKSRLLFFNNEDALWLLEHDREGRLGCDLWDIHCILHETIGHGSGSLAKHVFTENESCNIGGITYKPGDIIDVTSDNVGEFLAGYDHVIEELRAEIIALYVSINHLEELVASDLLAHWYDYMGREELIKWLILDMARTGLNRLIQQGDSATEITGDHARANYTIMNYLIDHEALAITEEEVLVDEKSYTVVDLKLLDMSRAYDVIKELMQEVQRIKSTGDGKAAEILVETYGRKIRFPEHMHILRANKKALVGDIKETVIIDPHFTPVYDATGTMIVDVNATWPKNIFEQFAHYNKIALLRNELPE